MYMCVYIYIYIHIYIHIQLEASGRPTTPPCSWTASSSPSARRASPGAGARPQIRRDNLLLCILFYYVTLCYIMLCYVIVYHIILCYTILYYNMLYYII